MADCIYLLCNWCDRIKRRHMRYHIMYSDTLILPDGRKVKVSEVQFDEPTHDYDVGTRMDYGKSKKVGETNRFLEDFMENNFVKLLEIGPSSYSKDNEA